MILVTQTATLPSGLSTLARCAEQEGFRFLQRLVADFETGQNRFAQAGEALFQARDGEKLVGVGGLNQDPYSRHPRVGRVRRLYVHPDYRKLGVARQLMQSIEQVGRDLFVELRLRTDTAGAAAFYVRLGYTTLDTEEQATHSKVLRLA